MRTRSRLASIVLLACVSATSRAAWADDGDDWLGRDKALHFAAAGAISGVAYGVSSLALPGRVERASIGLGAGLVAGAGKELYDLTGRGDPSWKDFTWDAIGAVFATSVALVIDFAVRGNPSNHDPTASQRAALVGSPGGLSLSW